MKQHFKRVTAFSIIVLGICLGAITKNPLVGLGVAACAALPFSPGASFKLGSVDSTYSIASPNTGTTLATMAPNAVRKLWQAGLQIFEQTNDFFAEMAGGADSVIWERTDLSAGRGQKITFTVGSGFYDEPHIGENLFVGPDDYEEFLINSHDLFVDWARHGTKITERAEEIMGMRNEIVSGFNTEQGKWLGRLKSEQLFMMFREQVPGANKIVLGGTASTQTNPVDNLDSTSMMAWDPIIQAGVVMKSLGGQPARVGSMQNGQPVFKNVVVACTDALYSLDLDPTYKQLLRDTKVEQYARLLFEGGYASPKGHIISEYTPIQHDGEGAIGSPLNPQAFNGNAFTAGSTVLTITGGGNPTSAAKSWKLWFKYFPNYAYSFIGSTDPTAGGMTVLAQDSLTHYMLAVNPPTDPIAPNKIAMFSYTVGNNGNTITTVKNLGPTNAGAQASTVGNVVWNTGVWAGKHTQYVAQGAILLPCNAQGQVYGHSFMLGKRCAYRGYGKYRGTRMQDHKEGGFLMERYLVSVFGQALRMDRLQRVPGVIRITHALQYAGLPQLPVIIGT